MSRIKSIIPHKSPKFPASIESGLAESRIRNHSLRAAVLFKKLSTGAVSTETARVFHLGEVPMQRRAHRLLPVYYEECPDGSYHAVTDDSDPFCNPHPAQDKIKKSVDEAVEGIGRAAEMYDIATHRILSFTTEVTFVTNKGIVSVDSKAPTAPLTATSTVLGAFLSPPSAPMFYAHAATLPL